LDVTLEAGIAEKRWELYRALSEPVRLRILALVAEEELTVGELAELLAESQPNTSRYVSALKQAGLVGVRRQGTRALVSLRAIGADDPVVLDAIKSGRALCEVDGSLTRLAQIIRARDEVAKEFFEKSNGREIAGPPPELAAYLVALGPLLPRRALALDAGTGDGGLLEVLAHVFEKVVAVDRSEAQLAQARARVSAHGLHNVTLVKGDLEAAADKVGKGADVVFAVRLLHHASKPAEVVKSLARLCAPPLAGERGGSVVVIDYAHHDDEAMREQADLWLGFSPQELTAFAESAGLKNVNVSKIPSPPRGTSPDSHLPWQVMTGAR
jgi:ArsR family transcriptional regulator